MKTLILFASRYGATEEIAYMLKSAVGGDVTVRNIRQRFNINNIRIRIAERFGIYKLRVRLYPIF